MSYNVNTIITNTEALLKLRHDETLTTTTPQRLHDCLGTAVMMAINETWTASKKGRENNRKAYYFSAEYLMGRLVYSNLFNLGILNQVKAALEAKIKIRESAMKDWYERANLKGSWISAGNHRFKASEIPGRRKLNKDALEDDLAEIFRLEGIDGINVSAVIERNEEVGEPTTRLYFSSSM